MTQAYELLVRQNTLLRQRAESAEQRLQEAEQASNALAEQLKGGLRMKIEAEERAEKLEADLAQTEKGERAADQEVERLQQRLQEAERRAEELNAELRGMNQRLSEMLALAQPIESGGGERCPKCGGTGMQGSFDGPEPCTSCGATGKAPDTTRATTVDQSVLPDCMMPDGAEPCEAYRLLQSELEATQLARDELERCYAKALEDAARWRETAERWYGKAIERAGRDPAPADRQQDDRNLDAEHEKQMAESLAADRPEPTGEALAYGALCRLKRRALLSESPERGNLGASEEDAEEVRQHLQAGVPEDAEG